MWTDSGKWANSVELVSKSVKWGEGAGTDTASSHVMETALSPPIHAPPLEGVPPVRDAAGNMPLALLDTLKGEKEKRSMLLRAMSSHPPNAMNSSSPKCDNTSTIMGDVIGDTFRGSHGSWDSPEGGDASSEKNSSSGECDVSP